MDSTKPLKLKWINNLQVLHHQAFRTIHSLMNNFICSEDNNQFVLLSWKNRKT